MDSHFYRFVRILCILYFGILHRASYSGQEKTPPEGPLIIAANHCSYLDPPLLSAVFKMRVIAFMAKKELFENKFFRILIESLAAYPVDRTSGGDRKSFIETVKILKNERAVLIFPEGTRTLTGSLQDFQPGLARLAMSVPGCKIIPVRIRGSFESFKGRKIIPRFCKISVSVGDCIDPISFSDTINKKLRAENITQELRRAIEEL